MKNIKVFTCFTGIGSPEMALRNLGLPYEVIGISEVDRYALLAYKAIHHTEEDLEELPTKEDMLLEFNKKNIGYNFSTYKNELPRSDKDIVALYKAHIITKNYGDIRKIDPKDIPEFDLFTYSYPCKNISVAGNQAGLEEGSGTQSSLLWECAKIIKEKKPPYLLMENVKNLVGANHISQFNTWIQYLESEGYNSYWKILNGKDYGVPQNRERVMMVSILKEQDDNVCIFPDKIPLNKTLKDILENNVGGKYFIKPWKYKNIKENLPSQDISYCLDAHYHKGISVEQYIKKRRRQLVQIGDFTKNEEVYIRRLTELECWRLMGFSDEDFYKAKDLGGLSNTKLYERAGRGIVVPMLEGIFRQLFKEYLK